MEKNVLNRIVELSEDNFNKELFEVNERPAKLALPENYYMAQELIKKFQKNWNENLRGEVDQQEHNFYYNVSNRLATYIIQMKKFNKDIKKINKGKETEYSSGAELLKAYEENKVKWNKEIMKEEVYAEALRNMKHALPGSRKLYTYLSLYDLYMHLFSSCYGLTAKEIKRKRKDLRKKKLKAFRVESEIN